jgi:hypothetical protein
MFQGLGVENDSAADHSFGVGAARTAELSTGESVAMSNGKFEVTLEVLDSFAARPVREIGFC